jgi:hypothetical protein
MPRDLARICIPVYKPQPSALEALSLARCVAVLSRHPLTFFGPRSLDFGAYHTAVPGAAVATFDDRYFRSLAGYSELLVTRAFYEVFAVADFLLVYQLDAFVFEDQLEQWCAAGYDYVGAPWLGRDGRWTGVGNGGFSLRRVAACQEVLATKRRLAPAELWDHVRRTTPHPLVRALKYYRKLLAHLGLCNDVGWFLRKFVRRGEPEDMFWGLHAPRFHPPFRVAPADVAVRFSVEAGLENAWPHLAGQPPFGCHRNCYLEVFHRHAESGNGPTTDFQRRVLDLAPDALGPSRDVP